MTHQSHQTNGASLEDCHTNFYALTDLCGIKWRKLVSNDRPNATGDPLDDPVLRSYSRCLAADILCVWRRVGIKNDLISIYDTRVLHPPLSLTAAKELWIFWYGEEPDLTDLVVPELLKDNEGTTDHGSWESGLTYEGRGLLFKALHNLIERSLLSRDVVLRLGRWFVQPSNVADAPSSAAMPGAPSVSMPGANGLSSGISSGRGFLAQNASAAATAAENASNGNERVFGKSNHNLSFSFAFFVHGDSTVCASIDLREHPAVRRLTMDHLNEAIQQASAGTNASSTMSTSSKTQTPLTSPGTGQTGGAADLNANRNNNTTNTDSVPKPRRVILAPFGMSGTLTGQVYRLGSLDAVTQKALDDWCAFYPMTMIADQADELPVMVEVVTGGVKLRYPTKYVLVSDMDEIESADDELANVQGCGNVSGNSGSSRNNNSNISSISPRLAASIKNVPLKAVAAALLGEDQAMTLRKTACNTTSADQKQHQGGFKEALGNDLGNPLSMHLRPTVATVLPERVWQDCMLNPLNVVGGGGSATKDPVAVGSDKPVAVTTALPMLSPSQIKQEPMDTMAGSATSGSSNSGSRVDDASACPTGGANTSSSVFKFIDPSQKATCSCTKCSKRVAGRSSGGSSSSVTGYHSFNSGGTVPSSSSCSSNGGGGGSSSGGGGGSSGGSGSKTSSSRSEKSSRPIRIPFHQRRDANALARCLAQRLHQQQHQNSSSSGSGKDKQAVAKPPSVSSRSTTNTTSSLFSVLGASQRTAKSPVSGGSKSANNSSSSSSGSAANDSLVPMTSCGNSPGSAEPSPHGNTTGLSQQSLPAESLPISSPSIDQSQQQQPPVAVTEKLFNSENCNSTNSNNSSSNLNSQGDVKTEDRLGNSAAATETAMTRSVGSTTGNNVAATIGSTFKGGCFSSKRKMDFGKSGSGSVNSNSAIYSGMASGNPGSSNQGVNSARANAAALLRRPTLMSRDYENIIDDDLEPHQLLYDYSSYDAWFNIAVKRCRVGEEAVMKQTPVKSQGPRDIDLYALHQRQLQFRKEQQLQQSATPSSAIASSSALSSSTGILLGASSQNASNSPAGAGIGSVNNGGGDAVGGSAGGSNNSAATGDSGYGMMSPIDYQVESPAQGHDAETGISSAEDEGGGAVGRISSGANVAGNNGPSAIGETKSLLTSQGLQPSIKDLEHLFDDNLMGGCDDNSNDDSIQVNTPPASNNSVSGTGSSGATSVSVSINSNLGSLGSGSSVDVLTKMYPTPPSLENQINSSPCGGALSDGGGGGHLNSDIEMKPVMLPEMATVSPYPNLGSPMEEPIEDWSYVFMPSKKSSLVGSTKYAPMTDLPSQALPPIQMSVNSVYEASWERKPKPLPPPMKTIKGPANNKENISQNPLLMAKAGLMNIKQEPQPLSSSPLGVGGPSNMGPTSTSSASVTNPMLTAQLSRPSPLQGPMLGAMTPSPLGGPPLHVPPHLRGMSPIGQFSPNPLQHPMNQSMAFRRTPLAPPPPYELAVASPANTGPNFSGLVPGGVGGPVGNEMMQHMQMQRMMMNQQQLMGSGFAGANGGAGIANNFSGVLSNQPSSMMMMGGGGMTTANPLTSNGTPSVSMALALPEADSLLVNVLLYDTLLNIFRDHNFDSSTICVCNASKKCVGNIRGADSGVYLALPGTSFAQMTAALSQKGSAPGAGVGVGGVSGQFDSTGDSSTVVNNQNGYVDEDPIACQCGFSAVMNRRLAHKSGLFYEDEMEITGMAVDPAVYKKRSLLSFVLNELQRSTSDTNNNLNVNNAGANKMVIKQEPGLPFSSRATTPMVSGSPDVSSGGGASAGGGTSMLMEAVRKNCDNADQEYLPLAIMDLLRDQCVTLVQSSSSSILRAIRRYDNSSGVKRSATSLNMLEYTEAHDVITLALEQARLVFEGVTGMNGGGIIPKLELDSFGNPIPNPHQMMRVNNGPLSSTSSIGSSSALMRPSSALSLNNNNSSVVSSTAAKLSALVKAGEFNAHKWPYVNARGPRSNQDIIRLMKSMQPILQDAFHKECKTRLWDAPYTVKGPLTWRQFHRLASSSTTDQCEPQPIPSIIVGHERDWLSLSPYALQYWDKLLLEPYSYSRDIAYIVVAPDNDFVVGKVKSYFKELSTTYEMCKLGRHAPIKGWDGVFRVGKSMKHVAGVTSESSTNNSSSSSSALDDWFTTLGESNVAESLRLYYQACQSYLVPYLAKVPSDKSLLDPPESYMCPAPPGPYGSNASSAVNLLNKSLPSPMLPPNTPEPSTTDKAPSTPKSSADQDSGDQKDSLNTSGGNTVEPLSTVDTDDHNPPCIMIYIVEPFTCGNDSPELQRLACLSLLRCYSSILNSVPESMRGNISFQIVSQESVCELGRSRSQIRWSDEMRCLALSVFSQCRRFLTHASNGKSLTGFGTAAQMELFLKGKDEKNRIPYKLYTPPYILSAKQEKVEKAETFGKKGREQQSSVLYCSYCLSKDQNWLLAVATDERGELLETATINIDIPNRLRRKKASARLYGLQKLMDFMLGIISQTVQPWRLVVGRVGRIGHGELKGWSYLLSKANLLKASKHLKEICKQCFLLSPGAVPSILSACLIAMEPDSNLRVMPDQFTPDERFSQLSVQNPLSTPQDVSCTHILVFPTSAIARRTAFTDHNMDPIMEDDFLPNIEDEDDMDNVTGFNDLFNEWDQVSSPDRRSRPGSPNMDEIMAARDSPGMPSSNGGQKVPQDNEEFGTVLQQPLSLGYLVSTAPMGKMPDWFWAACPHMENVCPVYLKTALHLHSPSIHSTQDEMLQQHHPSSTDHPLDSSFTQVVLRHVMEGYNLLSWLAMDSNTHDRLSCLPIHVQLLMQLYHMSAALT